MFKRLTKNLLFFVFWLYRDMIDEILRYLKCTTWWFDIHIHCGRILPEWMDTSNISHVDLFKKFFVRTFKFCSLSQFQLFNTGLPTIVNVLYIRSSDITHRTLLSSVHVPWEVLVLETTKRFPFAFRWNLQQIKRETSSAPATGKGRVWTPSCSHRHRLWQMCP